MGRKYRFSGPAAIALAAVTLWGAVRWAWPAQSGESMKSQTRSFLIDDFSKEEISSLGTRWQTFTDRVMGGISDGRAAYETVEGKRCLRLRGNVSLENRGGFIQVALPLLPTEGEIFNAKDFKGVRLTVRGNGEAYFIHLRTSQTRLPWQYYAAPFKAGPRWEVVEIPFMEFAPENLSSALDPTQLRRIAVVAASKAFAADVAVARLEFYR